MNANHGYMAFSLKGYEKYIDEMLLCLVRKGYYWSGAEAI
jgi:hypothetical protein